MKKMLDITERVQKKKACGIIYNIPQNTEARLCDKLGKNHIIVRGSNAYTSAMLLFRLGEILKVTHLRWNMIPGIIGNKVIVISCADGIKSSYSKVLDDFNRYKIPLLLLMHSDAPMKDFRRLGAYQRVLTIEQDYSTL